MSRLRSWWSVEGWLNCGLVVACALVVAACVLVFFVWIVPDAGEDYLGGNVGTTGLFMLILVSGGALLAILVAYSFLRIWIAAYRASSESKEGKVRLRLLNILAVIFLIVICFAASMFIGPVNPAHLRYQYMFGRRNFNSADLSQATLSNSKLREIYLWGSDLTEANLAGADFSNGNLSDTDLRRADLRGANLDGARLAGADLFGTLVDDQTVMDQIEGWLVWEIVNQGAEGRDFRDIDLSFAMLTGSNLKGANLSGSDLAFADFSQADLSEADLNDADLSYADLNGADLRGTNLLGADLLGTELQLARYNDHTTWPTGFGPKAAGAVKKE